jgi:hypothetical protein
MVDALNGRRFDPKMRGPQTIVPNTIVNQPFGTFCIIPNKGIPNDAPNSGVFIPLLSYNDPIIIL